MKEGKTKIPENVTTVINAVTKHSISAFDSNELLYFDCPSYIKEGLRCMFTANNVYCGDSSCVITPPHKLKPKT